MQLTTFGQVHTRKAITYHASLLIPKPKIAQYSAMKRFDECNNIA